MSEKSISEIIRNVLQERPNKFFAYIDEHATKAKEFIEKIDGSYLPILKSEKKLANATEKELPEQTQYHKGDIAVVQLADMGEKIDKLTDDIEAYVGGEGNASASDAKYRQMSEACVKYSIALDRVNVVGRDELREKRRQMLIDLDELSTALVQAVQTKD